MLDFNCGPIVLAGLSKALGKETFPVEAGEYKISSQLLINIDGIIKRGEDTKQCRLSLQWEDILARFFSELADWKGKLSILKAKEILSQAIEDSAKGRKTSKAKKYLALLAECIDGKISSLKRQGIGKTSTVSGRLTPSLDIDVYDVVYNTQVEVTPGQIVEVRFSEAKAAENA